MPQTMRGIKNLAIGLGKNLKAEIEQIEESEGENDHEVNQNILKFGQKKNL